MEPRWFVDFGAQPVSEGQRSLADREPLEVRWFRRTLGVLHGAFSRTAQPFALVLPEYLAGHFKKLGRFVRVFAAQKEHLESLLEAVTESDWMVTEVKVGVIQFVPSDFKGPWVAFHRVRAPRRGKMKSLLFMKRLTEVKALPSVIVSSQSTGQNYPLAIGRSRDLSVDPSSVFSFETLDSYGLSKAAAPVFVPEIRASFRD